jgi:hypothetical protein
MGTRNLFTIIHDGKVKLAKYNQWDGYLDGQGKNLTTFILDHLDFEKLKSGLSNVKFASDDDIDAVLSSTSDTENGIAGIYPLVSRDVGVLEALRVIQDLKFTTEKSELINNEFVRTKLKHKIKAENLITTDSSSFIDDGLFCEYAYTLNLDDNTITVFKGGNTKLFKCDILEYPETLDKYIAKQ